MKGTGIKRGALIVFEGCDKAGKTTQCRMLVEKLVELGFPAQMMQFPDRTTATGKIINDYLTMKQELPDQAIHLLFSANRWENQPYIMQLLQKGVTLVFDRYSYSGVAYSAAKPGMDFSWCQKPEIGFPKPDLVFLMHLPSHVTTGRNSFGSERYEKDEFLQNVYQNYLKMKNDDWMGFVDSFPVGDFLSQALPPFGVPNKTAPCLLMTIVGGPGSISCSLSELPTISCPNLTSSLNARPLSKAKKAFITSHISPQEVDAGKSIEELHEELLQHAKRTIERVQAKEIGELW